MYVCVYSPTCVKCRCVFAVIWLYFCPILPLFVSPFWVCRRITRAGTIINEKSLVSESCENLARVVRESCESLVNSHMKDVFVMITKYSGLLYFDEFANHLQY